MRPFRQQGPENQRLVYIIRSGEYAKVGTSRNPHRRMAQLNIGLAVAPELLATFPAARGLENKLHTFLMEHHSRLEWFHWCDKLESLVRDGLPPHIFDIPPGSPIYPNRGGRKPRMVDAQ